MIQTHEAAGRSSETDQSVIHTDLTILTTIEARQHEPIAAMPPSLNVCELDACWPI